MADSADEGPVAFWRASARFSGLVTGFHRFRAQVSPGQRTSDVFFPGYPVIRFAVERPQPWSLRIGARQFDMPHASFTGPTNLAAWVEAGEGALIGMGLYAKGWARLFGGDISAHANRVIPFSALDDDAEDMRVALDDGAHPQIVLEAWLDRRLATARAFNPLIERLEEAIGGGTVTRIEALAENLGLTMRQLAALTRQNFGFTPKMLLRRRRFLRALSRALDAPPGESDALLAAEGYWDRSHFLRDAHLFLGCSIREFRRRRGPLHALAMQKRAQVLGSAV